MEPLRFQKQTQRLEESQHATPVVHSGSTTNLEATQSRFQIIVELREQFTRLTGRALPTTLTSLEKMDSNLREELAAISRAHTILNDEQARWYEPIRTGWITTPEELRVVMRRNPLVYYPIRVVSELIQPLNLLTINVLVSTARLVGAEHAISPATSAPEISIPVFIGGSILAAFSLTTFYRHLGRINQGASDGISNPNAIAGSLTAKVTAVVDNARLKALKLGKKNAIDSPELAAHGALRWDRDAEIRMAKIEETRNALNAHAVAIREAREILDLHRHITLAIEEFQKHARDLGFSNVSPDEAMSVFAGALISAPEAARERVCEWLYTYTAVAEDSRVLTPVTPDFLKAGRLANADLVRAWKLFIHGLNTYERQHRVGIIHAVLNAVEELRQVGSSL